MVSLEAETGAILAMVGGLEFGRSQFNRVTPEPPPAGLFVQNPSSIRQRSTTAIIRPRWSTMRQS